eukprot:501653-Prymnesium_polylepis.1
MPCLCSPRVAEVSSGDDGKTLTVKGQRGERLTVVALNETIFRVTHAPDGVPRLDRTWSVVGDAGDVPRNGRARDDYSAFPEAPAGSIERQDAAHTILETSKLRVEAQATPGEHLHLRWHSVEQGCEIAADRARGAYMYDEKAGGGAVRHYMAADAADKYYGLGEASGALDRSGRRLRIATTDAMGYDATSSDPLYKHFPCFTVLAPAANGAPVAYGVL